MRGRGEPAPAPPEKGAALFRTIGEVAGDLDVPSHVLRFWESKFPQLRPLKRAGGRRYYRPEDVLLLRRIRQCLYRDGYTIRGVQQLLGGAPDIAASPQHPAETDMMPTLFPLDAAPEPPDSSSKAPARPARRPRRRPPPPPDRAALEEIRRELLAARALIEELRPHDEGR